MRNRPSLEDVLIYPIIPNRTEMNGQLESRKSQVSARSRSLSLASDQMGQSRYLTPLVQGTVDPFTNQLGQWTRAARRDVDRFATGLYKYRLCFVFFPRPFASSPPPP
jgi:hypothetical protein